MAKNPTLFLFSGASASGKTSLLNELVTRGHLVRGVKYSSRKSRGPDDDITPAKIVADRGQERTPGEIIDVGHTNRLPFIDPIVYYHNDQAYAIDTGDILAKLVTGNNVGVVVGNPMAIHDIKALFNDKCKVVFVENSRDQTLPPDRNDDRARQVFGDIMSPAVARMADVVLQKQNSVDELACEFFKSFPQEQIDEIDQV